MNILDKLISWITVDNIEWVYVSMIWDYTPIQFNSNTEQWAKQKALDFININSQYILAMSNFLFTNFSI